MVLAFDDDRADHAGQSVGTLVGVVVVNRRECDVSIEIDGAGIRVEVGTVHRVDQLLRGGHCCGERRAHFASIRNAVTVNILGVVKALANIAIVGHTIAVRIHVVIRTRADIDRIADTVAVIVAISGAKYILVSPHIDLTIEYAVIAFEVDRQAVAVGGCVIALINRRATCCEVIIAVSSRRQGGVNRCDEDRIGIAQGQVAAIVIDRTGTSDAGKAALNAAVAHIQCAID